MNNNMGFGLQKLTLLDYPGKVACTVFTHGCDFRCPFCHNASLVIAPPDPNSQITFDELKSYLKKRQGVLDGVCVTGGEPLMHDSLFDLLAAFKELGFAVKLDTN
ncbi:MAG: radical SAM protein, partial [Victivallaceae bacterium]|nr:radical SAM protein [Victivallaceae bacterium]